MVWEKPIKNSSVITNNTKQVLLAFLLCEDGGYLLLESEGRIIIADNNYAFSHKHTSSFVLNNKNS